MILKAIIILMPWRVKRFLLKKIYGYKLHKKSYIGLAWVYPKHLEMAENTFIDHFTVAIHLDLIKIGPNSDIGRSNWITGTSKIDKTPYFLHQADRRPELILGQHSSITKNHHIDCTNLIEIGNFVTVAGYSSQFLTHSIDLQMNRQNSAPILIGDYTFVGTNVVILGGSKLPNYSVLGAKSLLNKSYEEEWTLYGGLPAKPLSKINQADLYFNRSKGFVI